LSIGLALVEAKISKAPAIHWRIMRKRSYLYIIFMSGLPPGTVEEKGTRRAAMIYFKSH